MNNQTEKVSAQSTPVETIMHHNRVLPFLPIVFIVFVSTYMLWHRAWVSPDQFFVVAIIATFFIGRTKQFLRDWLPVLMLLFSYEYIRGIIPVLEHNVHVYPMIFADMRMFGFLPTIKLQSLLFTQSINRWYDYAAVLLYISHFVIPMVVGFVFWVLDRELFKKYSSAIIVLSYLAFATYVLFPAMPPWMASSEGLIPPLKKIMDQVLGSFASPIDVPSVYRFFGANLVAAVPSLHAAYPWVIFLFVFHKCKTVGLLILPYVFGVWFAVVYLGEHYVTDVLLGIVYASISYVLVTHSSRIPLIRRLAG